jgi:hypothetical protein
MITLLFYYRYGKEAKYHRALGGSHLEWMSMTWRDVECQTAWICKCWQRGHVAYHLIMACMGWRGTSHEYINICVKKRSRSDWGSNPRLRQHRLAINTKALTRWAKSPFL